MARRTSTLLGPDGTPVVHHRAGPGPEAEGIRHEARLLELARGLGVVDLVAWGDEADGGAWLSTRYVAGGTLTDLIRSAGEPAATAALARVGGALADLHHRGMVHGRVTPDHVVGGATGALLCGLSAASVAGTGLPPDALVDRQAFAALVSSTLTSDAETSRRARRAVAGLTSASSGTNLRAVATELWALARDAGWVGPAHGARWPKGRQGDGDEAGRAARRSRARSRFGLDRRVGAPTTSSETASPPGRPPLDPKGAAPGQRPPLDAGSTPAPGGEAPPPPLDPSGEGARPDAPATGSADGPTSSSGADGSAPVSDPGAEAGPDRSSGARGPLGGELRHGQPGRGRHAAASGRDTPGGRGRLVLAGAASAASLAVLASFLLLGDRRPSPPPEPQAAPAAPPAPPNPPEGALDPTAPASEQAQTPAPVRLWPRPVEARPEGGPAPAPPADGPAGPVADLPPAPARPTAEGAPRVDDLAAPVVEHAGARYAIGLPGDLVVLGDWDCDGITTPVVVRPDDGSVWSFPSWTTGGEVLAAEPLTRAPAPLRAVSRPGSDDCDVLAITTAEGDEVLVQPSMRERPGR